MGVINKYYHKRATNVSAKGEGTRSVYRIGNKENDGNAPSLKGKERRLGST